MFSSWLLPNLTWKTSHSTTKDPGTLQPRLLWNAKNRVLTLCMPPRISLKTILAAPISTEYPDTAHWTHSSVQSLLTAVNQKAFSVLGRPRWGKQCSLALAKFCLDFIWKKKNMCYFKPLLTHNWTRHQFIAKAKTRLTCPVPRRWGWGVGGGGGRMVVVVDGRTRRRALKRWRKDLPHPGHRTQSPTHIPNLLTSGHVNTFNLCKH